MNRGQLDIVIFLALVMLSASIAFAAGSNTTFELQLHDIYFVVDRFSLTVLLCGPLVSIVFLPLAAIRRFESISTNAVLIIGLVLVAVICYSMIELQTNYLLQANTMNKEELSEKFLSNMQLGINLARAILAVAGCAAIILIYKTVRLWKQKYPRTQL